jgi:hypothetical protein
MAIMYILNNPNFKLIGFTQHEIFQLWGESFNWAIIMWNLKTCPSNSTVTKWEIYHGFKPDLRTIRLLPIFSVLYVLRSSKTNNPVPTNKRYWKRGLYVGPSIIVPGSIRVAIKTNKRIKIVTTSNFKGVSDGGALQIYNQIDRINTHDSADIPDVDRDQDTNATPVESADPLKPSTSDVEPSSYNHPSGCNPLAYRQSKEENKYEVQSPLARI